MTQTPFRDRASELSRHGMRFQDMADGCDGARSASWWHGVVRNGAWGGSGHLSPPTDVQIPGIAKLFGRTEAQLKAMIAEDWYGVTQRDNREMSPRVKAVERALDALSEEDAARIADLIHRLQPPLDEYVASLLRDVSKITEDAQ